MTMPAQKIEIGLLSSPAGAFRFTLDDPLRGKLDDVGYPLGGDSVFIDITDRVRNFNVSRGRSNLFSAFPAGQLNVSLNNHDRAFDPLYTASPFYGDIVPRREVRVSTGTAVIYTGWIDDWNYSYTPDGNSIADAIAYDATSILSGQTLSLGTPVVQLSGARVSNILDQTGWSPLARSIDVGQATLGTAVIEAGTNVMSYLQQVATTEVGLVFIGKDGSVSFVDRAQGPSSANLVTFGGTGIPYQSIEVNYGSDNLYNSVALSRVGGGTATATDLESVLAYGERTLTQSGFLLNTDADLATTALALAEKYSLPEYRFNSVEIALHKLSPAQQQQVLGLEIGTVSQIIFTPNGIGDAIDRYVQVISINHTVNPETHFIDFGFQAVDSAFIVLDDAEFGKLDTYALSW